MNNKQNTTEIMKDVQQEIKKNFSLERYVQTILLSIITASLIGAYVKVTSISDRLIKMETKEESKISEFKKMEVEVQRIQVEILALKERILLLESKHQ